MLQPEVEYCLGRLAKGNIGALVLQHVALDHRCQDGAVGFVLFPAGGQVESMPLLTINEDNQIVLFDHDVRPARNRPVVQTEEDISGL